MSYKKVFTLGNTSRIQTDFTPWLASLISGGLAFVLYELTNAPGFFWGDSGEFMAVSKVLGIGHAYGHPLFWLLGRISMLILPSDPSGAMNTLVALFSAGTCSIVSLTVLQWIGKEESNRIRLILSVSVTGLFMGSLTFWTQASYTEVYNVQAFFICLSFFLLNQSVLENNRIKPLLCSAYFLGIASTLGMYAAIWLILPFGMMIMNRKQTSATKFRLFTLFGAFFILGLTVWIYLPVRSSLNPPFMYQPIDSFSDLLHYLRRAQFMSSNLAGSTGIRYVLQKIPQFLIKNLGALGLLFIFLSVPGTIKYKKSRTLFTGYCAAVLTFYLISVLLLPRSLTFVQMIGMEVYFLSVYIALIPLIARGAFFLMRFLREGFVYLFLILFILQIIQNFQTVDISEKHHASAFQQYLVEMLPRDATLYPYTDEILHPIYHACLVKELSPDFGILTPDPENRSYSEILNGPNQKLHFYDIDQQFISKVRRINRFKLAGPLVTADADSHLIHRMENEFVRQFLFDQKEVATLNRQDRFAFGMFWMNRGAYWFNRYKRTSSDSDECLVRAVSAYQQAALLDDFTYLGAFSAGMLAQLIWESGRFDKADQLARKSRSIHPYARPAWFVRYRMAIQNRAYQQALEILKGMSEIPPRRPHDYFELANLNLYLNNLKDARMYYYQGIRCGAPPDSLLASRLGIPAQESPPD